VEGCREIVAGAPSILEHLCGECRAHFDTVCGYLGEAGIKYSVDHTLVRGLDYYTRTAFEVEAEGLGAQNAVAGGGRYDGLVKELGGPDQPAIGFAVGVERLVSVMERLGGPSPDLYLAPLGGEAERKAFLWALELRKAGYWVEMDYASRSLKAHLKRADRMRARRVLIVGDEELASGEGVLRDMETKAQERILLDGLVERLGRRLSGAE
jgi:histidyl-tRNA synthetase